MKLLSLLFLLTILSGCISITASIQQTSPEGKQTVKADTDQTPTTKGSLGVGVGQAPVVTSGSVK